MIAISDIRLTWLPLRNGTYCAMLGRHEVAFVMRRESASDWAWRISHCNGTPQTGFNYAPTLEGAKSEVLAGIQNWFRQAGLE
ncbi:hypothetical protein [Sinorhizobium alkalisoli]|uniref:Uncharacterized protein n=1 Tax=Sinorhizobium alkalisoli TaxID=1752398 RepID=A0A1E3VCF0_9HYPH|nr:hypothetical protein [Sinorhizobium alkalisoli]MCA1493772.1 hypothetical protein [Ensifer sp. NBAIM29]MCG5481492.1 hypothetical protein [Sinorhizobium alkalisoli]ODR91259.1 hypothetical protein A8M32_10650 [Sinorhizobium alkalisoli]QFI66667.1 hypothetical protein EKH55_1793 [Sinorhizobium alkalisoli]